MNSSNGHVIPAACKQLSTDAPIQVSKRRDPIDQTKLYETLRALFADNYCDCENDTCKNSLNQHF
jgi:hypothetical protein